MMTEKQKKQQEIYKQALTVGYAIRLAETAGKAWVESSLGCDSSAEDGKKLGQFAWNAAVELMTHYPDADVDLEPQDHMDFPMSKPILPN